MTVKTALAEALFASDVQPSQGLGLRAARHEALRTLGRLTEAGCACCVAAEYGNHPDTAAARMKWARTAVGVR